MNAYIEKSEVAEGGQETTERLLLDRGRRRARQPYQGGWGFPSARTVREWERRKRPPTSRAQRRYLAEGKSLWGHPRRLLRSSSGLPYFRVHPDGCVALWYGAWARYNLKVQGRPIHRLHPSFSSWLMGRPQRIRSTINGLTNLPWNGLCLCRIRKINRDSVTTYTGCGKTRRGSLNVYSD